MEENSISNLISRGYYVIEDFPLDFHAEENIPDISRIGEITGSTLAEASYNVTGKGITIAVVDTGVDFSNPDIKDSLARDKSNHPIMIDVDGQGIILTNATFFAYVDKDSIIRNYSNRYLKELLQVYIKQMKVSFLIYSKMEEGPRYQYTILFFLRQGLILFLMEH